jgi:flavocytochrome c
MQKEDAMTAISMNRRNFLGCAGALGLTLGAGPAFAARNDPLPKSWDETADVVVVGSGFAGLCAAYEAHKAGASVVILEKMATPGGNSIINGGIMGVPGTEIQKRKGIKDSPEQMFNDMMKAGLYLNHADKVRTLCNEAYGAYRMLVDEIGVKFSDTILKHEGGHSVPRSLYTVTGSGSEIVNKLLAKLSGLGVKPRTRTFMEHIWLDGSGRAVGVTVRENYRFGKDASGLKTKTIRAKKGIVLAYGGFGSDVAYRSMFDPRLGSSIQSTNQPGATSEAWREAAMAGAQMIQEDWIQCLPYTSPDEKGFGIGWAWAGHTQAYGFWIDGSTGERFVNELADRKIRCDAIFAHLGMGHDCLSVGDAKAAELFKKIRPGFLEREKAAGVLKEYATTADLCRERHIPEEAFRRTVAAVNESVKTKKDPMGRRVNEDLKPCGDGPWFVTRLSPKVHHCMGGILTTAKAEVLDCRGSVIPGLYAAGEATGGVHGAVRLGSCATTDCVVNGRIAGREAARG